MSTGATTVPVHEGNVLAGKYRIDKVLGAGGMGVVVAAHHIHLDDKVAIKFLLPEAIANGEIVERFAREARAAVKIKSEHVARVSDVGTLETGAPYMVMEYLEGGDLSDWLEREGPLPVEQAVDFMLQACEAIAEAHALGIVHRDLKPANLFVIRRPDGALSVKVLDFGISKVTRFGDSGGEASMTKTSALMGSPLYMSPEQMQSAKDVDARSDIWALGAVLYELVAGEPPFKSDTMPELVLQIMSSEPRPLRDRCPGAPEGLEAVLHRCLEKDRGKRYESVAELAVALLPFAPRRSKISVERISGVMKAAGFSESAFALPPSSNNAGAGPEGSATAASWGRTTLGRSRGPWMFGGGIALVVALGATAVALRQPAPAAEAPSASAGLAASVASEMVPASEPEASSAAAASASAEPPPGAPSASASAKQPAPAKEARRSPPEKAAPSPRKTSAPHPVISPAPAKAPSTAAKAPAKPHRAAPKPAPSPARTTNVYDDRK